MLVDPEQPVALADTFEYLSRNTHLLERMGERGLERVKSLFTWRRIAQEMLLMYQLKCTGFRNNFLPDEQSAWSL
ncbi:hypothetical protein KRR40_35340 [Niabella defluvii]|nr:hypothetical protein KRR40_35340 [Niabella sp. I65]